MSVALLPLREPRVEAAATEGSGPGLLAGVQVLRESPLLASVVLTATLLNLILSPMSVLFAPYTLELGAGAASYGLLASSIVVGQLVGLALLNVVTVTRSLALMVGGTLTIALGVLGLAVAPSVAVAALCGAALGLAASAMSVQLNVMFQSRIAPEVMGRAMGLFSAVSLGAQPLGFAAAGALLTQFGIRTIFAGVGLLTALASGAWLRPGVRKGLSPEAMRDAEPA